MRLPILALLIAPALLAGCVPPVPPPASSYRAAQQFAPIALQFAPDADEASPVDSARLRTLRFYLPAGTLPELVISGPHALRRAQAVRRLLERPVIVRPVEGEMARPDAAVLVIPTQGGVIADACLGPGQPVLGDIWPGDDARRASLLPAGCAVETALQSQVVAHGGASDLLRGRALPPGAATPFADAIEHYYRRNDPNQQRQSPAGGGGGGGSSSREGGSGQAPTAESSSLAPSEADGANPLLGPLPRAQSQPSPAQPGPAQGSRSQQPWSPSQ